MITHYYENCYVKEIIDREEEIVRRIRAKFEELNKVIPIDTYTIDFCVDPNSDKVWLIEINNPVSKDSTLCMSLNKLLASSSWRIVP